MTRQEIYKKDENKSNQTVTLNVQYICLSNGKIWPTQLQKVITLTTS